MTVCSFYLQGRCRYGDKCWNEHPRGGNKGGGFNDYNRSSGQQQPRTGGFGNRVWVNPQQRGGGGGYIQPSSFSQGSNNWNRGEANDWNRGSEGRRENIKSSEFSFSNQNRFSALGASFDRERGGAAAGRKTEEDEKNLEIVRLDMDAWESSGQWVFSCYSNNKTSLSGFTDLSPEELRLEFYSARATGNLQNYLNGVSHLLSQWKNRVQELKTMSPSTGTALLAELNGAASSASSSSFGSTTSGFGSSFESKGFGAPATVQASTFSFSASNPGFGSSAAPGPSGGFGSSTAAPTQPPSGFGSVPAPSASSFSFTSSTTDKPAAAGFGSASGFSFSSTGSGFGAGFGSGASTTAVASSSFGQTAGSFGAEQKSGPTGETAENLFTPEDKLSEEELNQFKAKRFTLGQIPLKPPPGNLLMV